MELINREDHQKLYLQLYDILKKKIESGEWAINSQIPTEEDLCSMFSVSRATVRTAVLELVRHGYLKRQQGKGTFIFKNVVSEGLSMLTSFRESLFEESLNFSTSLLARTVMMPVDDLDARLDIPPDKHIIYIKRLRLTGNEPVLLQESYIPYHICPLLLEDDIENISLLELFEKKYGIRITKSQKPYRYRLSQRRRRQDSRPAGELGSHTLNAIFPFRRNTFYVYTLGQETGQVSDFDRA